MRTIKFRGERIDNGEWVYGYLYELPLESGNVCMILTTDNIHKDNSIEPQYHLAFTLWKDLFVVDSSTVGQFTGLYDKNGKEIYEGDIVKKHDPYNVDSSDYTGAVIWGKGRWAVPNYYFGCWFEYDLFFDDFTGHKQEVIGNIYDNPELLKDNGEESI